MKNTDLSFDIILPFYKDFKFLDKCINSINRQTLKPKKLIFIDDDNRTINLKKNVKKKLSKKIKLIFIKNKINKGPSISIKNSLKYVTSKYFYITATDDIILDGFAKYNLNLLDKYKNAAFVFSDPYINNLNLNKKMKIKLYFLREKFYKPDEVEKIFKSKQFKIYHNTVVFKTKNFKKKNILIPKLGQRVDMLNLLKLAQENGFVYSKKCLSLFTVRSDQFGKKQKQDTLIKELIFLKKKYPKFYNFFHECALHFDLSIFSLYKIYKNDLREVISFLWIRRSISFVIWKKIRFFFPDNLINKLFYIFSR